MAKQQSEKTSQSSININKYGYDKNEAGRYSQLAAFFHMLKTDLGQNIYCEFATKEDSIYIPYSFNLYETSVYALKYSPEMMYIELDENNYVEITFDNIDIHGTAEFISKTKQVFKEAETYRTYIEFFEFDFNSYAPWLWQKFLQQAYERCMEIGNDIFKNGNFMVYPIEEFEYYVITKADFQKTSLQNMEYIVIRSNIQMDKMLLIDINRKLAFATGFDELEQIRVSDYLKPTA